MLARYNDDISSNGYIKIEKYIDGKPVLRKGTVKSGSTLLIELSLSRKIGDGGAVLRICKDGEAERDIPFRFGGTANGIDRYSVEICPTKGLYFWEILLLRGNETLFVSSINNEDFELCQYSKNKFRLLAYDGDRKAPEWFWGGTMYQIFPDRFYKGSVSVPVRKDAVMSEDWNGPITQYAEVAGGHVENNLFFGGTLWGVIEKLDYLKSLGVSVIYLNPIFEAYSNHKYDTGDYEKVDPMLGGDEALKALIEAANRYGMKLILDGVFNHTGSDSRYFNAKERYPSLGAYNSKASPYFGWYNFTDHPSDYESWWGIKILPRLDASNETCRRYFTGNNGIGERYVKMGIGGWRLDVADELSDRFLDEFSNAVKGSSDSEAVIIGEVWENAVDKVAYGNRRRYFTDGQLDSVMNYPLRNAIIEFCTSGNARWLYDTLTELYSSYPENSCNCLMNILGTHDTERILTRFASNLGECDNIDGMTNPQKAKLCLSAKAYNRAKRMLKLASTLQFTVYGVPSVYYGDEVGLDGATDPFCRKTFPWGREDGDLLTHYKRLGEMRKRERVFADGDFCAFLVGHHSIGYRRHSRGDTVLVLASRETEKMTYALDGEYKELLSGKSYKNKIELLPDTAVVLKRN